MARSPKGLTNRMAFDLHRRQVESNLRGGWWPDDPTMRRTMLAAAWAGRYGRALGVVDGAHGSAGIADRDLADRLAARWRARDTALPGQPAWPDDFADMLVMVYRQLAGLKQLDAATWDAPHGRGPSLRALWLRAEAAGADTAGCMEAVSAWARRPPPSAPTKAEEKRLGPHLATPLRWRETADPDHPWETEVEGQAWRIRLGDFPDELPYTLLVAGKPVGGLLDWPEAWRRGATAEAPAPPPAPAIALPAAPEAWPARYQAGEHGAVWAEMTACGPRIREAPFAAPAEAVARETMRRVRRNVETLLPRLAEAGYAFGLPAAERGEPRMMMGGQAMGLSDMLGAARQLDPAHLPKELQGAFGRLLGSLSGPGQPAARAPKARPADPRQDPDIFAPPDRGAARTLAKLARRGLPVPLSLRFWLEEVGRLDLTGRHPVLAPPGREGGPLPDPLALIPDADDLAEQLEEHDRAEEPVPLILAYSPADKAAATIDDTDWEDGIAMLVPAAGADAPLTGGASHPGLVPYLRQAFRHGGFPGWEGRPERPADAIAALTRDLLDF